MSKPLFSLSAIVLVIGMIFFAALAYVASAEYENVNRKIAAKSHLKNKIIGFISQSHSGEIQSFAQLAERIKRQMIIHTVLFFILCAAFILLAYLYDHGEYAGAALLLSGAIALIVGLCAPIISVVVYKEVPVIGQAVIQFESRGIISSIEKLWNTGNHIVAVVIFIFSVIVPLSKTAAMGYITVRPKAAGSRRILKFFKIIGKWSMTDVFIVALIISVFSFSSLNSTNAVPQIGLYYFTAFVILSMMATYRFHETRPLKNPLNTAGV